MSWCHHFLLEDFARFYGTTSYQILMKHPSGSSSYEFSLSSWRNTQHWTAVKYFLQNIFSHYLLLLISCVDVILPLGIYKFLLKFFLWCLDLKIKIKDMVSLLPCGAMKLNNILCIRLMWEMAWLWICCSNFWKNNKKKQKKPMLS